MQETRFIIQETRFILEISRKIEETKLILSLAPQTILLGYLASVHRFDTMKPVFVFFILCTFQFSSINKEYHSHLGYHLSLGTRFRQKPQHLASIHFLRWKN